MSGANEFLQDFRVAKSMEKYLPILQDDLVFDRVLPLDYLRDSEDILTVHLADLENGDKLTITFDSYLAYRKVDEGNAFDKLAAMSAAIDAGKTLYLAEGSDFLQWFHKESYKKYIKDNPLHYVVTTLNDIIDVISLDPPRVSAKKGRE